MRLCLRGSLAKRTVSILIILRKETSWGSGLPRGSAPGAVPACAHSGSWLSRHEDSLEYRGWGYTAVKVEKEHIEVRQPEGGQQPLLPAQTGRPAGFTSATVPPPTPRPEDGPKTLTMRKLSFSLLRTYTTKAQNKTPSTVDPMSYCVTTSVSCSH